MTPRQATDRLIADSSEILADVDDGPVFWLALAATQWDLGALTDDVPDRALEIIDSGTDLHRWQESAQRELKQRKKHLEELRARLVTPPPKARKLKPRQKSSTDFLPGDVGVFQLDERTAVRFCVLHLSSDRGGTYADICVLWLDDGRPFQQNVLRLADTAGPHYTMLSHEPASGVRLLRRGVEVPAQDSEAFRAWKRLAVNGCACTWKDFPERLRAVLPKLGWV